MTLWDLTLLILNVLCFRFFQSFLNMKLGMIVSMWSTEMHTTFIQKPSSKISHQDVCNFVMPQQRASALHASAELAKVWLGVGAIFPNLHLHIYSHRQITF